jgi:hypothetical protein
MARSSVAKLIVKVATAAQFDPTLTFMQRPLPWPPCGGELEMRGTCLNSGVYYMVTYLHVIHFTLHYVSV